MGKKLKSVPTVVAAVQSVFSALEPFSVADQQRILDSAAALFNLTLPAGTGTHGNQSSDLPPKKPNSGERPLSPVELIQQKNPATNAQRLAIFAYYRENVEGHARFARDDLKQYFSKARVSPPQNFDRDFKSAVQAGWIYEDGVESYLTTKGIEAVETGFDGKTQPRGKNAMNKLKKKSNSKKKK